MEQIIIDMIEQASETSNYQLIGYVSDLISEFATTVNCPSNWRNIGEELATKYYEDTWVYEQLELWNYE